MYKGQGGRQCRPAMYTRGDWCRTLPQFSGAGRKPLPVCKEYTKPLGDWPPGKVICALPHDHFFGPLHAVIAVEDYIAVRVPRLDHPTELIWVNVQKGNTRFAHRIKAAVEWPDWRNWFRD